MKKLLTIIALATAFMAAGCQQMNREVTTFTVDSKESRVITQGDSRVSKFFVYGTDGEVFLNEDVWVNFGGPSKFDSASVQAKFKAGRTYEVETIGWRIPFLSIFPNIVSAKDVTPGRAMVLDGPDGVMLTVLRGEEFEPPCIRAKFDTSSVWDEC